MNRRNFFGLTGGIAAFVASWTIPFGRKSDPVDPLAYLRAAAERANARITAQQEKAYADARNAWVQHLADGLRTPDRAWFKLVKSS